MPKSTKRIQRLMELLGIKLATLSNVTWKDKVVHFLLHITRSPLVLEGREYSLSEACRVQEHLNYCNAVL